jgi:hypothetical protein
MTIEFPLQNDGKRSSTIWGTNIVAAAMAPINPTWAQDARVEKHWRRNYPQHFYRLVAGGLESSATALQSAQAGLDTAWQNLTVVGASGNENSFSNFYAQRDAAQLVQTKVLRGQGSATPTPWRVPYRGSWLEGKALEDVLSRWQATHVLEPSAADALRLCAQNPQWFDLSDLHFALLGAGSEAGPLTWLLKWRANIYAVDLPRQATWDRIVMLAQAGNAVVHVPMTSPSGQLEAGINLLEHPDQVSRWLNSFDQPLAVAAHAYADGEKHVRVVMACDFVQQAVLHAASDKGFNSSIAFMATPTDVFAVTQTTAQRSLDAYAARPMLSKGLQSSLRLASGERFFQANIGSLVTSKVGGHTYGVADSLVLEQGPNYALAKRLQQWRAIVSRANGITSSLNVAPSTTTSSVVKNPALAAGFAGADMFGMEVFEPETTNALMAAMWVHDLRNPQSSAKPSTALNHPYELFMHGANHGGLWSCAYKPRSALPFAAALGWVRNKIR